MRVSVRGFVTQVSRVPARTAFRRAVKSQHGKNSYFCTVAQSIEQPKAVSPVEVYNELVSEKRIQDDRIQRAALDHFEKLYHDVVSYENQRSMKEGELSRINRELKQIEAKERKIREVASSKGESWFYGNAKSISLFGGWIDNSGPKELSPEEIQKKESLVKERESLKLPRGLYVFGGPGSGKTFLMDLFYETLPSNLKRRIHFNEFMLEVHRSLHKLTKKGFSGDEMMHKCVEQLSENCKILCFDEFQITDIADAMIVKQLFSSMYENGVLIIMTSNRATDELYKNGIQRNLFIPFIEDLKKNYQIVLMQSEVDYRSLILDAVSEHRTSDGNASLYFLLKNEKEVEMYETLWNKITQNRVKTAGNIRVQARDVPIAKYAEEDDVARFNFFDLCGKPLGPADYQTIANNFHTIFIDEIPEMSLTELNQLRRFITLIDTLYDQHVVVIASGEKPVKQLLNLGGIKSEEEAATNLRLQETDLLGTADFVPSQGNVDEVFAFQRTVSRLQHMQVPEYIDNSSKKQMEFIDGMSPLRFFNSIGLRAANNQALLDATQVKKITQRYFKEGYNEPHLRKFIEEVTLFFEGHCTVTNDDFKAVVAAVNVDSSDVSVKPVELFLANNRIESLLV